MGDRAERWGGALQALLAPVPAPTVAVVDGYSTGRVLAARLRAAGARCMHVRSRRDVPAYFLRGFDPGDYVLNLEHTGDLAALAGRLAAAGATRVVPGTESGVALADALAHLLGLPGNAPDGTPARRHKGRMAEAAAAAGLATPRGRVCDSAAEAAEWVAAQGLAEAVVKPVNSAGTDHVRLCTGPEAVRAAARAVLSSRTLYGDRNRTVLVQERLHGTECYLNTVSAGGVHRIAETWRYVKRESRTGSPAYDYEEPVPAGSAEAAVLHAFTRRVLDALGVREGAAHTEVMLTARGPVLVETGARLGGATAPDVVERYCGVSQAGLLTATLLDPAALARFADREVTWRAHVRNVGLLNGVAGTVRSLRWVEALRALPTAVAVLSGLRPGEHLPVTSTLLDAPGYVYLASPDPACVRRDYARLRALEEGALYTS